MSTVANTLPAAASAEISLVTFRVGDVLMGIDIRQVEEIHRQVDVTNVPHAPDCIRGVINLRGNVVTVVDLRTILQLPPAEVSPQTRIVIVGSCGEQIGLLVDRIGEVVSTRTEDIDQPPTNVTAIDGRFFQGVCKLDSELLVVLDVEAVLGAESPTA